MWTVSLPARPAPSSFLALLYKKALAGEIERFTGMDDPYVAPEAPEGGASPAPSAPLLARPRYASLAMARPSFSRTVVARTRRTGASPAAIMLCNGSTAETTVRRASSS